MKRQNLRALFLTLSFLLFPITQFFFSPAIIIGAAYKGIISGSFFVFSLFFIGGIFLGRSFCAWVMPCGGLQEILFSVNNKPAKGKKLNMIKYLIWLPWLLFLISLFGLRTIQPMYQIESGVSIDQPFKYIIFYIVIFVFLILSLIFGKRASCHYFCWMSPFMVIGQKLGQFLKLPSLALKAKKENCTGCGICNTKCPMSLNVKEMVLKNNLKQSECILCGNCIDCCPKKVLSFSFKKI